MLDQKTPGVIVNTGSKQGITCPPGDTAYNITKAGVKVLTEGLAHSLRNIEGCRVTAHLLPEGLEGGQPEAGSRAASDHIRMLTMRGRRRRGIMAATPRRTRRHKLSAPPGVTPSSRETAGGCSHPLSSTGERRTRQPDPTLCPEHLLSSVLFLWHYDYSNQFCLNHRRNSIVQINI